MSASRLRQVGQAVTALSAVFIVYATLSPSVSAGGVDDRVAHFLLFLPMGLGGVLWMAQLEPQAQRRSRLAVFALILVFAVATELGQSFVDREPDLSDVIADAAGAGIGVLVGSAIASRARRD